MAVGVGFEGSKRELNDIVSRPVEEHRFMVGHFHQLAAIRNHLYEAICKGNGRSFLKIHLLALSRDFPPLKYDIMHSDSGWWQSF